MAGKDAAAASEAEAASCLADASDTTEAPRQARERLAPGPAAPAVPASAAAQPTFVQLVEPFWKAASPDQRATLLSVSVQQLRTRAVARAPRLAPRLEEGLARLRHTGGLQRWRWEGGEFADLAAFRDAVCASLPDNLGEHLPCIEPGSAELPAEAAFRDRMRQLWLTTQLGIPDHKTNENRRQCALQFVEQLLEAIKDEHACLRHTLLPPAAARMRRSLPPGPRHPDELVAVEQLKALDKTCVTSVASWHQTALLCLGTALRPAPGEVEAARLDLDHERFSLSTDGRVLCVREAWVEHVQKVHEIHKRKLITSTSGGLSKDVVVLAWISDAAVVAYAADAAAASGAAPPGGTATARLAEDAYDRLVYPLLLEALRLQAAWEARLTAASAALAELGRQCSAFGDVARKYAMGSDTLLHMVTKVGVAPGSDAAAALLRRELALAAVKQSMLEGHLHRIADVLREECFLTRALEPEVTQAASKDAPDEANGPDSGEAAAEEVDMAVVSGNIERVHYALTCLRRRMKVLADYRHRVQGILKSIELEPAAESGLETAPQPHGQAQEGQAQAGRQPPAMLWSPAAPRCKVVWSKLKQVWSRLHTLADERSVRAELEERVRALETQIANGRVVLLHLWADLASLACDDPGEAIAEEVVLPLLHDRLLAAARDWQWQRRTAAAEQEIAQLDVERGALKVQVAALQALNAEVAARQKRMQKKAAQKARKAAAAAAALGAQPEPAATSPAAAGSGQPASGGHAAAPQSARPGETAGAAVVGSGQQQGNPPPAAGAQGRQPGAAPGVAATGSVQQHDSSALPAAPGSRDSDGSAFAVSSARSAGQQEAPGSASQSPGASAALRLATVLGGAALLASHASVMSPTPGHAAPRASQPASSVMSPLGGAAGTGVQDCADSLHHQPACAGSAVPGTSVPHAVGWPAWAHLFPVQACVADPQAAQQQPQRADDATASTPQQPAADAPAQSRPAPAAADQPARVLRSGPPAAYRPPLVPVAQRPAPGATSPAGLAACGSAPQGLPDVPAMRAPPAGQVVAALHTAPPQPRLPAAPAPVLAQARSAAAACAPAAAGSSSGGRSVMAVRAGAGSEGLHDTLSCPITCELMRDPVVAADGHTYERTAIADWLRGSRLSPMTGLVLPSDTLVPNIAVRKLLSQYASPEGSS